MRAGYKIGIASTIVLVLVPLFGWVVIPKVIYNKISTSLSLQEENPIKEMYLKVPFPLDFKIFVFNLTNPEDVTKFGAKPKVEEIGPYFYEEWKEKVDIVESEEEDSLSYTIKNTFIFNENLSSPLTGKEIITVPHPLIAVLAMAVKREQPNALLLVNKAFKSIHNNPETPFLTTNVQDLLFNGVPVFCNVTDFAGKGVCLQLKLKGNDFEEVEPGILKFSLFGGRNGTKMQRVKVKRGIENIHDLGKLIELENKTKLGIWDSDECNNYRGTDSTIFPPFLTPEEGLVAVAPDLCRSIAAYYVGESEFAGIPTKEYRADFGDQSKNEKDKCYCPSPDQCLKKGVFDMFKCIGAPFWASLPHCLLCDRDYLNSVDGLHPNKTRHQTYIHFESLTGSPLAAKKRMQFNLFIQALPQIDVMKNLSEALIPIFWIEEGIELNSTWTLPLKTQLFGTFKILNLFSYISIILSIIGLLSCLYLHCTKSTGVEITVPSKGGQRVDNVISTLGENETKKDLGYFNHGMTIERSS